MLKGIDVSHHNNLDRILSIIDKPDFCIIKATEGITYNDPKFKHNVEICTEREIPIGFYHYARPEKNDPISEAKHFIDRIAPYIGKCILALDWEDKALDCSIDWALKFLNYVYCQTGVKSLFYCSSWYTTKINKIYENDYGLWVAQYTSLKKPSIGVYPFWAMWQYATPTYNYTNETCVCDYDYFNGSKAALNAYMTIH